MDAWHGDDGCSRCLLSIPIGMTDERKKEAKLITNVTLDIVVDSNATTELNYGID
jgi:hypothetical protein